MRRLALRLLDSGPVVILALIAGAGSFTHIRQTAIEAGQTGWMAWAVAVCVDLTCVMAARERQRDKKIGRPRTGPISWPTVVLTGGIVLSLAANLHQAQPSIWGWLTAATPAVAFLVAVSMLERRAAAPRPASADVPTPAPAATPVPEPVPPSPTATDGLDETHDGRNETPGLSPALVDFARKVADEHTAKTGKAISRDTLRARLGVSNQLATDLLRQLQTATETA